jgi:hypothetical protein
MSGIKILRRHSAFVSFFLIRLRSGLPPVKTFLTDQGRFSRLEAFQADFQSVF